jgi:TonB family protein
MRQAGAAFMIGGTSPRGLTTAILVSAFGHVALFVLAVAFALWRPSLHRQPQNAIITKLVRLGTERPPDWLPRKPSSPPPAAAEPVPIDVKGAAKPTEHQPMPTAKDRVKQLGQVSNALERLKHQQTPEELEGSAQGVAGGEVSSLAQAIEGNRYVTEIVNCLKNNYAIEGVSPGTVKNRTALVLIRVERDGSFIESKVERSSGVPAFDRAVERALKLCGRVSPPPAGMRDQVRNDGIEVEFQP